MPQAMTLASQGIGKHVAIPVKTATATLLTAGTTDRKNITILNRGPNSIYIGFDSTVTTNTGYEIVSGGTFSADYGDRATVYAIAATADQASPADTRVLETR